MDDFCLRTRKAIWVWFAAYNVSTVKRFFLYQHAFEIFHGLP